MLTRATGVISRRNITCIIIDQQCKHNCKSSASCIYNDDIDGTTFLDKEFLIIMNEIFFSKSSGSSGDDSDN